jgi:deoxyribose-phosphate aldolase
MAAADAAATAAADAALATGPYTRAQLLGAIDHSVLQPQLTTQEARAAILVGRDCGAASCCVRPCDVALAAALLAGSPTLVCTVIGFPHGSVPTAAKVAEAHAALAAGAAELDMVLNIGKLRSGDEDAYVQADIAAVVAAARARGAAVKVILETAYLSDEQKARGCRLAEAAGAAFAKTSSGFAANLPPGQPAGATLPDLALMRAACGPGVRLKAAGGVRTLDQLLAVLRAGAVRVGATATAAIAAEFDARAAGGLLHAEGAASGASGTAAAGY